MSEPNLDLAQQWGAHLAELPTDAAREQAIAAARQARMLAMSDEELEALGKAPVRTLGEFLDAEIELPPMLVQPGLVARGGVTAMSARGGKGKTTLSFNRLLRWGAGAPLFDELPDVMVPTQPLRSLIIENEGAGWHTQRTLTAMLAAGNFSDEQRDQARENVHVWGDGGWSAMKLDNEKNVELVKRGVEASECDILFLEPFRGLWRGEENSSTEMSIVMDAFHEIANEYGCAVMVTHHERKGNLEPGQDPMDAARGSGVFTDLGAVVEQWKPVADDQREWKLTKWRWDDPPAPVRMRYDREIAGYHIIQENENERRAVSVLTAGGPGVEMTVGDIATELNENQATVRRWLDAAVEDGRLKKRMASVGHTRAWHFRLADAPDEDDSMLALT